MPIPWVKWALKEEQILHSLEIQELPTDETITAVETGTINILTRCSLKQKCSLLLMSCVPVYRCLLDKGGVNWFLEWSVRILLSIRSDNIWELVGRGEVLQKDRRKGNWECQGMSVSELYCNLWLCWNHTANWWWREQRAAEQAQPGSWVWRGCLEKTYINSMSLHRLSSDTFVWAAAMLLSMCSWYTFQSEEASLSLKKTFCFHECFST